MKILQISYSLSSGGGERFVVDLSNRLARNEQDEIILLTVDDDRVPKNVHYLNDVSHKIKFVNLHCKSGLTLKAFWRVLKMVEKEKPDIVHAHCNLLLLCLPSLFVRSPLYIHTLHNMAAKCLQRPWMKAMYHWFYNHRIQPITISRTCQQSYVDLYGENNAVCITNGRESMRPSENKPNDVPFLYGCNCPVFIHVARCAAQKNQCRLFKTFDRLQAQGEKFQLIVIGTNYEDSWMPIYKENKQIHILGVRKNVADYMALADYFVLSSDYEGLPLTLLEAMSLGVVPVCTPAGGVVDVLGNGRNGYLTKTFDDDEFYELVKSVIENNGRISHEEIRKDYEKNYSMRVCAHKYYEVYRQLLNEKK